MPLKPPMMNMNMKPTANQRGVAILIDPPHRVAIQLNILTPVGTAMAIVVRANTVLAAAPKPTVNMWWLHTPQPMKPIMMPEKTTKE